MKYDYILVRFGELTTKGKNRKSFTQKLLGNIKKSLEDYPRLKYQLTFDRIYIYLNDENETEVCDRLQKVFGIHSFSLCLKVETDLEKIKEACTYVVENQEGKTFKVDVKRSDKTYPLESPQLNRIIAGHLFNHVNRELEVDVHHPDILLKVELRKDYTYIMDKVIKGAGGYPVGIGGKAMLMLSGGIDSPVAAYLMLKRGVEIECIHFAAPPYTSQRAQEKVLKLCEKLLDYTPSIKVHIVPFTTLQLSIYDHCDESYAMTCMRRMMLRVAEKVANNRNCLALANGESLGQVASQTLDSMHTINAVTSMPILRPVVCLDKLEIIEIANKIGTYEISIEPYEDCCTIFTPKQPATKPKIYKVEAFEKEWDYQTLVDECVNNIQTIEVSRKKDEFDDLF